MIDELPKNGQVPKGRYLSLLFFQNQITKSNDAYMSDLQEVRTRIRDIIDFESKRKGKKTAEILKEEEYLNQYFKAHSLDFFCKDYCRVNGQDIMQDKKFFEFIDKQFLLDYPLFYAPKWKIWFSGSPTIKDLAILNHLAFGYFYGINEEDELAPLLRKVGSTTYLLRQSIEITMGVAKLIKQRNEFSYVEFIQYSEQYNDYEKIDPRKNFNHKQLKPSKPKDKNDKAITMTLQKLQQETEKSPDAYNCLQYQSSKADNFEIEDYLFKLRNYYWSTTNLQPEKQEANLINLKDKNQDQHIIKSMVNFQNSAKLVPFLEKIPNFAYKLSGQEREIIETKGNMIIIGRSGTGKTTCALLRLFSLQTLLKIKSVSQSKFTSRHLNMDSPMKNVLLTASPFLIEELKKNYKEHLENVRYQLEKKQGNVMKSSELDECLQKQGGNLQNLKEVQENIRKINNKMRSLKTLTPADFPGFFTIKNFLIMVDGVYNENFFMRNKDKQLYSDEENSKFKMNLRNKQSYWIKNVKGVYAPSSQINYQYFRDFFWKIEIEKRKDLKCGLNSMMAWTEIFSTIEGSTAAHKCPQSHISEQMYIQSSKNKILNEREKRQIFLIFKLYRNWKLALNKFDLSDLVNHLLRKLMRNSYLGPTINCMFIDQVQDLTPATIYLVSQIASNNLFYAGDTAQSISKGVTFKFSDIKLLFREEESSEFIDKQEPQIKQLTVNFRSHNNILRIANCLIKIIQLLFPKTIDSLRKETSIQDGPRPIIVEQPSQILELLKNKLNLGRNLNSKQAIIVRSEQKKAEIQKIFLGAIVLTLAECKGLEYDDIVVWDLLEDSNHEQLWKILDFLSIENDPQRKKESKAFLGGCSSRYDEIEQILSTSPAIKQLNLNNYYELCSQIKLIYTAVTRAKEILIIYNSLPEKLLSLCYKLNLVQDFSSETVDQVKQHRRMKKQFRNGALQQMEALNSDWIKSGIDFFKKQNYQQAWNCFNNAGDHRTCRMVEAKIQQKEINKLQENLKIAKEMRGLTMEEFKQQSKQIRIGLEKVAKIYEEIQFYEEAGRTYFQNEDYKKAFQCFNEVNMFLQMAYCLIKLNQLIKAAEMFEKSQMYEEMLQCLMDEKSYTLGLIKMIQHHENFNDFYQRKNELKHHIIRNIEQKLVEKITKIEKRENSKRTEPEYNRSAFYKLKNQPLGKRTNENSERMMRENERNCKVIRSLSKLSDLPMEELKISLYFDKMDLNQENSIGSCLNSPLNVRELITQCQKLGYFNLCLILAGYFEQYQNFEDYFVITLDQKWKTSYKLAVKKRETFDSNDFINNELCRINFEQLSTVQQTANSKVINDLVRNLILFGFYEKSQIFFENKTHFYQRFLRENNFINDMKLKFRYRSTNHYSQECQDIFFMRNEGWHHHLQEKEVIYSLQILYKIFDNKRKRKSYYEMDEYDKQYELNTQQYGRARRKISQIVRNLNIRQEELLDQLSVMEDNQKYYQNCLDELDRKISESEQNLKQTKQSKETFDNQIIDLVQKLSKVEDDLKNWEEVHNFAMINTQRAIQPNNNNQKKGKKNNKNKKNKKKNKTKNNIIEQEKQQVDEIERADEQGEVKVEEIHQNQEKTAKQQKQVLNQKEADQNSQFFDKQEQKQDNESKMEKSEITEQPIQSDNKQNSIQQQPEVKKQQQVKAIRNGIAQANPEIEFIQSTKNPINLKLQEPIFEQIEERETSRQKGKNKKKKKNKNNKTMNNNNKSENIGKSNENAKKKKQLLSKQNQLNNQIKKNRLKFEEAEKKITILEAEIISHGKKKQSVNKELQLLKQNLLKTSELADKIECRIKQYEKNGTYFKKFMAKQREMKIAHIYLGKIRLNSISCFLSDFYSSQNFNKNDLDRIFQFRINQSNHVAMCQVMVLALQILSKQEILFDNFYEFIGKSIEIEDEGIQIQQNLSKIHQFFNKIVHLLQSSVNSKFTDIIFGFFGCRTFLSDDNNFLFLKNCAIAKQQTLKQLKFNESDTKKLQFFDINGQFLIGDLQYFQTQLIEFIINSFQNVFKTDLIQKTIQIQRQELIVQDGVEKQEKLAQFQRQMYKSYKAKQQQIISKIEREFSSIGNEYSSFVQLNDLQSLQNNKQMVSRIIRKLQLHKSELIEIKPEIFECQKEEESDDQKLVPFLAKKEIENEYWEALQKFRQSKKNNQRQMAKIVSQIISSRQSRQQIQGDINMNCVLFNLLRELREAENQNKRIGKSELLLQEKKKQIQKMQLEQAKQRIKKEWAQKLRKFKNENKGRIQAEMLNKRLTQLSELKQKMKQKIVILREEKIKKEEQEMQRLLEQRRRRFEQQLRKMREQQERRIKEQQERKLKEQQERRQRRQRLLFQQKERERLLKQRMEALKKESNDCAICMIEMTNLTLECGHQFHIKCIMEHLKMGQNKNCPLCRKPIFSLSTQPNVVGVCEQCNRAKLRFSIYNFYYSGKKSLFCGTCEQAEKSKRGNEDLYSYFLRRSNAGVW